VGLKDLRVHDLRHSFASALVNAGGTLYDAQRLLGHSSSRMTERYAHLTLSRLTNAASDVSNHFNLSQLAIGNGGGWHYYCRWIFYVYTSLSMANIPT